MTAQIIQQCDTQDTGLKWRGREVLGHHFSTTEAARGGGEAYNTSLHTDVKNQTRGETHPATQSPRRRQRLISHCT